MHLQGTLVFAGHDSWVTWRVTYLLMVTRIDLSAAAELKKHGRQKLTLEERKRRRRALKDSDLPSFQEHIKTL